MIARIRREHDTGWGGGRAEPLRPPCRARRRGAGSGDQLSRGRLLWRLLAVGVSIGVAGMAGVWRLSPGAGGGAAVAGDAGGVA